MYKRYKAMKVNTGISKKIGEIIEKPEDITPDDLQKIRDAFGNKDVIGYLDYSQGGIEYPIMYSASGNQYYLYHNIYGQYSAYGSIYLDYENKPDFTDKNNLIYGHNMWDVAMFGNLEASVSNGIEEKYFTIYTEKEILTYKVLSAAAVNPYDREFYKGKDTEKIEDFYKGVRSRSRQYLGDQNSEHFTTLITCTRSGNKRFCLTGFLIRKEDYVLYKED